MSLRDDLTESVLASSRWNRRQVGYPELERLRAAWIDRFGQVFVGHSSISVPEKNLKLVAYDDWPVTSGELARAYLRQVFVEVPRRSPSPHARGFGWQAPIHCVPVRHRSLAYVDLVSAYWQLLGVFRPDDLVFGATIVPGQASWLTRDAVDDDRHLRHCIVGSVFANQLSYYRFGKRCVVAKTNPWSNPTLKLYCMQTLHAVCGRLEAITNLHAWLTDAAIVDRDDAEPVRRFFERDWLLASRLKAEGPGAVVSATTYQVGEKASFNIVHGTTELARAEERKFSNLKRVPASQLQRLRQKVAA